MHFNIRVPKLISRKIFKCLHSNFTNKWESSDHILMWTLPSNISCIQPTLPNQFLITLIFSRSYWWWKHKHANMNLFKKSQIFFLYAIVVCCLGNLIPHHRKVRQIRPKDVKTVSEEEMANMTPEQYHALSTEYVREFFKPIK